MVVKIIFWLFIVAAGIRLSLIMVADYPRRTDTTIQADVLSLIIECVFLYWLYMHIWA